LRLNKRTKKSAGVEKVRLPTSIKETRIRLNTVNTQLTKLNQKRTELHRQIQMAQMKGTLKETGEMKNKISQLSQSMEKWNAIKTTLLAHMKTGFPKEREK